MSESTGRILVVDDETSIRRALSTTLNAMGFLIDEEANGEQAIQRVREERYDAVLLDVNMPGMGGLKACRELRRLAPRLAIIMLTVRDEQDDKIEALDSGADDYVTKPFQLPELAARLRASVRRSRAVLETDTEVINIGDLELDPVRRALRKNGQPVRLTPKEFELLHYLMAHAGMPITHARLLRAVWGAEYGSELEYLRTFVRQLRKKIGDDATQPQYLLTDPYIGYRFREPDRKSS